MSEPIMQPLTPLPCAFCGSEPARVDHTGWAHPKGVQCVLAGWFIGTGRLDVWNTRCDPPPRMTVVDGKPFFGRSGDPVGADMLNSIVSYYESKNAG